MNDAEQLKQYLHYYSLLQTDAAKFDWFGWLKKEPGQVAKNALRNCVEKWIAE